MTCCLWDVIAVRAKTKWYPVSKQQEYVLHPLERAIGKHDDDDEVLETLCNVIKPQPQ